MHVGLPLRKIADEERAACPNSQRQAVVSARASIEKWRTSANGQTVEQRLAAALALPSQSRQERLSQLLSSHADWLPSYLDTVFGHLAGNLTWQPPLTDFATDKHIGLYLIEKANVKLSLIVLRPHATGDYAPPAILRLSTGHVMLCPISSDTRLSLTQWQCDPGQHSIVPSSNFTLTRDDVVHCQLSQGYLHFALTPSPIAMLRLEWPEDEYQPDRYFDAASGARLPNIMGSAGFRRHMALSALCALNPMAAAEHLASAIYGTTDDALGWHYCRQLLTIAPQQALPILIWLTNHKSANLRHLAGTTLAMLRTHYSALFAVQ